MVTKSPTLVRGALGLLLAALWFGLVGPWSVKQMDLIRAETTGQPGIGKLVAAAASQRRTLLPRGEQAEQAAVWLETAMAADVVDRTWTARAFAVLDPDQRRNPTDLSPRPRFAHQPWLDPQVSDLLHALGQAHGWSEAAAPPAGMPDVAADIPRLQRSLQLISLAEELRPDQAHALQALALEVALAQQERFEAEAGLVDLLDDEILTAAQHGIYDIGRTDALLTVLRQRAAVD